MIFTTINKDLTSTITGVETLSNKMGILGNSFSDIFNAYQGYGMAGVKNLFANTSDKIVTSMDIDMLKNFNNEIANGVPKTEALQNTMFGASKGARALAENADKTGVNLQGLSVAEQGYTATTIGARVATVAFQAALTFGIAIAIQGLITLFQKLKESIPTVENTTKWLEESSQEVKDIQDDINDLNDKLKTTKDRIDELVKKPSLTIVEQNELDRLQKTNAELERKIQLQERALQIAQGKNSKNFVNATEATRNTKDNKDLWNNDSTAIAIMSRQYVDMGTESYDAESFFNKVLEAYKNAEAAKANATEEELKNIDEYQNKVSEWMSEYTTKLQANLDELGDFDYETLSDEAKAQVDYINDALNTYNKLLGNDSTVFSNIYNQERFAEGKKAIDQLKESGNLTAESLENLYKSGTNASFNAMIDNFKKVGLIADTSTNSFGLLANQINGTTETVNENGNVIDNTAEKVTTFKQLMEEKGTDKNPSFVEGIEKSVEQLQKLEDALVKFESGTLTDKEKTSLFKAFPQLTAYADNLGEGIRNLLSSMRTDTITNFNDKIAEFKKNGATEEDISKLESYRDTILKIADAVDSVKNALDSIKTVFTDLDGILKDYNENGYFSIDNLDKLSENGQRYLQYLTYENGQLKINEEAYKKLVLAQIDEIETKATLQATSDLQSLTDETTAKEYLAKVNIELADSQLTAAQAAFQYALALKLAEGGNVAKAAQKVADNLNTLRNIFASARSQVDDYSAAMLGAKSATEKKAQASEKAKKALEAEQHALEHSKKALEQEKKALEENKSEYEKAQNAIKDLISWTEKYIKQLKEDEVKALEDKKSKFDEIIDAEKEAIEQAKKLREAEDELGEKTNTVAKAKLQSDILSLDDSGAGKKAYKKAQEEYKTSQKDLQDYLYNREVTAREEALDKLKEDTDKSYDEQIKTIQDYLSDEVQLYRDACSMIDNDNGTLYAKLLNYCLTYTTTGKTEFDRMWTLAQSAMEKYNVASVGTMQFMDELKGRIYDIDDAVDTLSKSIQNYEDRLTEVKNQLDDIKDAAIEAKNAIDIANSTPLIAKTDSGDTSSNSGSFAYAGRGYDASRGMYYYKVQYGDRDYFGYVGDSSDTDRVRNSAALAITKEIGKYVSGFENYGLSQIQGLLKVNAKNLGHYATGTKHSPAEFISQENGLEAIFAKNPNGSGSYTLTTPNSKVFDDKRTNELYDFSGNPSEYIKNALIPLTQEELSKFGAWGDMSQIGNRDIIENSVLSGISEKITGGVPIPVTNNTNNMSSVVNINIQGDATQSTVNALHAEAENIIQRARSVAHNDFIETVLKGRKWR